MTTAIGIEDTSENGSTPAVRDMAGGSKNRTILAAIKAGFRTAMASIASRDPDAPKPAARKRRGGTDSRAPVTARPSIHASKPAARGRYAAMQPALPKPTGVGRTGKARAGKIARRFSRAANDNTGRAAYEAAGLYLASGLELVQFWQDNAGYDCLR